MLKNSEKVYIKNGELIRDYIDVKEAGKLIAEIAFNNFYGEYNICSVKEERLKI